MRFKVLQDKIIENNKNANILLVKKAYEFASKSHKGKKRLNGEVYIQYPLNTAYILAELKLDETTIAASLLHKVLDSNVSSSQIEKEFGTEITSLILGIQDLTNLRSKTKIDQDAEIVRKMLLASTSDVRVILIKLASKLHNMRTLNSLDPGSQKNISKTVLDIYAPLAYRLGIEKITSELQDLAFKYLNPTKYKLIERKTNQLSKNREQEIKNAITKLKEYLGKNKIKHILYGRSKGYYSIYNKMQKKNREFESLNDILGLRIITNDVKACYESLGIIHNLWKPIPSEFDDYIAMPKSNLYQSIHTSVIDDAGKLLEIQIRTKQMHEIAEEGIAAHYRYKNVPGEKEFDKKLSWIKEFLDLQQGLINNKEFLEGLKLDFFQDEIFTFTPKGKVIKLPKDSVPIDFAYAVHSDVGDKCNGARVNNKFVSLKEVLKNGDIVEIITSKSAKPSRDWLKLVRTTKAKVKIKQQIRLMQKIPIKAITPREQVTTNKFGLIEIEGISNPTMKFSQCCSPLPGDLITAFSTKTGKVIIHKQNCTEISEIKKEKLKVNWIKNIDSLVNLNVTAIDRTGLFKDMLNTITNTKTKIEKAHIKSLNQNFSLVDLSLKINNLEHLKQVLNRIKKVKGVKKLNITT